MVLTERSNSTTRKDISSSCSKEKQNKDGASRSQDASFRSRIRQLSPICKSRKSESACSFIQLDDVDFDKQLGEKEDECSWLSSGTISPLFKFCDFRPISFPDRSRVNSIEEALSIMKELDPEILQVDVKEAGQRETLLPDSVDNELLSSSASCSECAESIYENSPTPLGSYTDSPPPPSLWDLDPTEIWVSLINLESEDSRWISNIESGWEDIKSDFPSPTYENTLGSESPSSSGTGRASSTTWKHKESHDDLAAELLSLSVDWNETDFGDPLFWPFDMACGWSSTWDHFIQSPRKSTRDLGLPKDESTTCVMKRLYGSKKKSKHRRFLLVSGLSALKMTVFKRGCHSSAAGSRIKAPNSRFCKPADGVTRLVTPLKMRNDVEKVGSVVKFLEGHEAAGSSCVQSSCESFSLSSGSSTGASSLFWDSDSTSMQGISLINLHEEDSQWISEVDSEWEDLNSNFPSPSSLEKSKQDSSQDELTSELHSGSMDLDELDLNEPLIWPFDKGYDRSLTWDCVCPLPQQERYSFGSPNDMFTTINSIRVRIHGRKAEFNTGWNRRSVTVSGLNALKMIEFKRGCQKNAAAKRNKAISLNFGKSAQHFSVLMGYRVGATEKEITDPICKHRKLSEEDFTSSEQVPIETILGLNEFDGHEGVDPEFNMDDFSLVEYLGR
ncbi:hypothetical protein Nepgr_020037 [Nepenthes gracilis]|uniref:Uncharacterized protein n=1 Tax=Nepenthes gracilis TaxID=150966 RepID=A0AAD3XVZ0_NEPGR|nr:hypothetical protein Nepgr_020037 [Nepenthes gracilis]